MTLMLVGLVVVLCSGVVLAEVYYTADFSDDIVSCPDFENNAFNADDLTVGLVAGDEDDADDSLGISGSLNFAKAIEDGYEIQLKISRVLEIGKEMMYSVIGDICSSLTNEDAPWYPLALALGWTECPIPAEIYELANMKMSVAFANDVLCHDFCGDYEVELQVKDGGDTLACYVIFISIVERERD